MRVSVIITAYNHQDTLQRAIDSVQAQRDVEMDIVIIDDTHTQNGMLKTFHKAFKDCRRGDYICFCDGDDYWIDDYKLKNQLDYMENNKDCGLCFTRVAIETEEKTTLDIGTPTDHINKTISFDTLLKGNANIHAQSYMIRKSVFDEWIDFSKFLKFNVWDYPIVLELIRRTRFHCMDFYSAVFVKSKESATQTESRARRFKYVMGNYRIKAYYILKYGCKPSTLGYLIYRFTRDIYSVIFKRWIL